MKERVGGSLAGRMKSGAVTQRSTVPTGVSDRSPYKSKWEAAYASKLELEKAAGIIKAYYYEPFSLWLPGGVRYKPDFMVDGSIFKPEYMEIIEVKGWSKNRRDGITRLKIAAALFPCFRWTLAYRVKGGGWEEESV